MQRTTVVLVEGASDRLALECLGERPALDLDRAAVKILDIGGAANSEPS